MCRRSSSSRMAGPVNEAASRHPSLLGALPSNPPEFYALSPKWVASGSGLRPLPGPFRPLSRRSGCVPAEPYPPLRFFQSGRHQPRRATIFRRTAITPLTFCLTGRVHRSWDRWIPFPLPRGNRRKVPPQP
jgi:hypothetical protein